MTKPPTKTVTVLFADEDDAVKRWIAKGWRPISRTYTSEPDPNDQRRTLTYVTVVFERT